MAARVQGPFGAAAPKTVPTLANYSPREFHARFVPRADNSLVVHCRLGEPDSCTILPEAQWESENVE
jgi:hypothetical protein